MVVLAALVASYALAGAFFPTLRAEFAANLFSERAARALGHLVAGGIALFVGALQFSTRLRLHRPSSHRLLGRVYLVAALVSGGAALMLAPVSTGGVPAHFGFGLLAFLWLVTSYKAYARARSGEYAAHREWMIRSYALCLAAVTLRIYLPLSGIAGIPFEEAYPAIAWLCWVPNIVVAEWFFVRGPFAPLDGAT
jgi:uncharacterized membrane protein